MMLIALFHLREKMQVMTGTFLKHTQINYLPIFDLLDGIWNMTTITHRW